MSAHAEAVKGYQQQRRIIVESICNTNTSYTHYSQKMKTMNEKLSEIDAKIMAVLGLVEEPDGNKGPGGVTLRRPLSTKNSTAFPAIST